MGQPHPRVESVGGEGGGTLYFNMGRAALMLRLAVEDHVITTSPALCCDRLHGLVLPS